MDSFNPGGLASLSRSETTSCAQQEECATRLPQAHADMPEDGDDVNMLQVTGQGELRDDIEVRTQPRGATFIKTAGDMPSSSNAKAQLWESGASSGSSTLVGTYGRDQVVGHIRTISGSSSARKSRLSSSNSHEAVEPISRAIPEVRGSAPTRDSFSQSGAVDSPRDDTPSLTVRQTPRSAEERHRSFPTTRLQPRPQTHRQSHASQSSIPPLSPLMPLIFQPDLPLAMVAYASRLARILHAIYPILYFGHVPITLFLDFNILYALIQIAAHPEYGGQGDEFGYIQASPRVNPWWIAVGFYALSTMTWFVVVLILHDLYYFHFKVWNNRKYLSGNILRPSLALGSLGFLGNPSIIKIFTAAPSFHISCTRSFNLFSAL